MRIELTKLEPLSFSVRRLDHLYPVERYGDGGKTLQPVRFDIPGNVYHSSYLDCLSVAWDCHRGVVITPDLVWYDLLCEFAGAVRDDVEAYRHLFTSTEGKQEILVQTSDPEVIPVDRLVEALGKKTVLPPDLFLPQFTTTTPRSRLAHQAAFADAASPYYNYSMYCCGIPFVDVRGSYADWEKLASYWRGLGSQLHTDRGFHLRVCGVLNRLLSGIESPDFWRDIFSLERCGSGGQVEVGGWYSELFRKTPPVRYVENFSPHASRVDYRCIDTSKSYRMFHGVFSSALDDDLLTPEFGWIVYEVTD